VGRPTVAGYELLMQSFGAASEISEGRGNG
jgi:hypothetical protein